MAKRRIRIAHAEIVQRFAKRLRELRLARDMTQAELARHAHVALSHLSKLETGGSSPGIDLLERLANALEVPITSLLPSHEPAEVERGETKRLIETLLATAGPETLLMLRLCIVRYLESPSAVL